MYILFAKDAKVLSIRLLKVSRAISLISQYKRNFMHVAQIVDTKKQRYAASSQLLNDRRHKYELSDKPHWRHATRSMSHLRMVGTSR